MNKYKRNLESLRAYLNRDKRGLELLDAIARDVTEQRKQIALFREKATGLEAQAKASQQVASDLQLDMDEFRKDADCQRTIARRAESEAKVARKAKESIESAYTGLLGEPTEDSLQGFAGQYTQLVKSTKRRMPRHPCPLGITAHLDPPTAGGWPHATSWVFDIDRFIKDFREPEFTTLGMFAAIYALSGGVVAFIGQTDRTSEITEDTGHKLVGWFRKNIGEEEWKQRLYHITHPTSEPRPDQSRYG